MTTAIVTQSAKAVAHRETTGVLPHLPFKLPLTKRLKGILLPSTVMCRQIVRAEATARLNRCRLR